MVGARTASIEAETGTAAAIVVGVDTHKSVHHAAVVNAATGALLGDAAFPADGPGYTALHAWAAGFGPIHAVGIEQTGSYGAGLARQLTGQKVTVLEVTTTDRATRARRGKDDRTDAIAAAGKVLAGMATAIRDRTAATNQARGFVVTAPEELRQVLRPGKTRPRLLALIEALPDPSPTQLGDPGSATVFALKGVAARIRTLDAEVKRLDKPLRALTKQHVPTLLELPQVGPVAAARLAITVADNIDRLTSEAAFARLTGIAPIPVSSGNTHRMRLHRGGDRQANSAIHMIVVGRLKNHAPTRAYMTKKLAQQKSKKDAIRCLKRFAARGIFNALKHDLITT